jgi:phosphoenolpyruvate---glycerone phosphotransferase subunit DhaK
MLDRILEDSGVGKGERVSILVNSLGATPLEELYIIYRRIRTRLDDRGVAVVSPLVGCYATSMEMSGVSVTLCRLDGEIERLLAAPCDCPFWKN